MKYPILLSVLLIFKVLEINATSASVTIPGYAFWYKCLTTNQNATSDNIFSYDVTSNKYSSIYKSGFGYKFSFSDIPILTGLLLRYSVPLVDIPNYYYPVDLGGFFVYLFDSNSRDPTGADAFCGSTTSFVKTCTHQKTNINPNWCLLIGNFYVNQSVNFDISYQTYDTISSSTGISNTIETNIIITSVWGGLVWLLIMFCV
ncbi:8129_t:CDS:2 [Cetraspora pellucida]|uniref:8129_t:CDS:1 n=1 Tax=Cetraspora pellucida TaxID=1433469 RepID=A0A9N8WLF3_9GLOM|nr:8129_t:CDS:2 [Cetraspora pellucida]